MAKDKTKGARSVPNKHLHARVSFLHQAATLLAVQGANPLSKSSTEPPIIAHSEPILQRPASESASLKETQSEVQEIHKQDKTISSEETGDDPLLCPLSFHLSSHLRQVARRSQIRLHPSLKRTSCKTCNAVLIEGQTCRKHMENASKCGKKRHADILVLECRNCGSKKRFPVGVERQERKSLRLAASDREQDVQTNGAITIPCLPR